MTDAPLVTIVTPSYNQGRFIAETIESVLTQDYPHVEYIIMDGGSKDETAEVAARYTGRLTFISERDRGQSHAINKGFQRARGEIVAWINSDDTLLPGAIRRAVEALAAHPEAAASYGEGYLMDEAGFATCRFPHTQPFDVHRLVHASDYILQQSVFFRRAALEEIGWVREDLHYAMDWDLLIRLGQRWPLHYEPAYFGCLREYGEAKTFSGGARRIAEITRMLREHTGQKWPPGVLLYGLGTYEAIACHKVAHWFRAWPAAGDRAQLAVSFAMRAALGMLYRRLPGTVQQAGWYLDGLCAPGMMRVLPGGTGTLTLVGRVPPTAWLGDQRLTVSVNGAEILSAPVRGEFCLRMPVSVPRHDLLTLAVAASHSIVPIYDAPHLDGGARRIAFALDRIEWLGNTWRP
ncbi:MAG: glycosyltransferase [Bryobacterales bacterium]|nr:glycosyltransferase [Bryobacterales bacterium]